MRSICYCITRPPETFADEIGFWFREKGNLIKGIERAERVVGRSEGGAGEGLGSREVELVVDRVSVGGLKLLKVGICVCICEVVLDIYLDSMPPFSSKILNSYGRLRRSWAYSKYLQTSSIRHLQTH